MLDKGRWYSPVVGYFLIIHIILGWNLSHCKNKCRLKDKIFYVVCVDLLLTLGPAT